MSAAARASASAAGRDGNFAAQLEARPKTIVDVINGHFLCSLEELLVHDHGEAVHFAGVVAVLGFIQNHRQGWSASAAGLQENPYGADFLPLEVIEQNLFSFVRDIHHKMKNSFQMDCLT